MKQGFFAKLGKGIKNASKGAAKHIGDETKRGFGTLGAALKDASKHIIGDAIISLGVMMLTDVLKTLVYEPLKRKIKKACEILDENADDYVAQF